MAESNIKGALAYIPFFTLIVAILIFFLEKKDKTVKFHALQSLGLVIVEWVISMAGALLAGVMWLLTFLTIWIGIGVIFGLLFMVCILLMLAVNMCFFILRLYLMYSAYQKKKVMLPFIGNFVEKNLQ